MERRAPARRRKMGGRDFQARPSATNCAGFASQRDGVPEVRLSLTSAIKLYDFSQEAQLGSTTKKEARAAMPRLKG